MHAVPTLEAMCLAAVAAAANRCELGSLGPNRGGLPFVVVEPALATALPDALARLQDATLAEGGRDLTSDLAPLWRSAFASARGIHPSSLPTTPPHAAPSWRAAFEAAAERDKLAAAAARARGAWAAQRAAKRAVVVLDGVPPPREVADRKTAKKAAGPTVRQRLAKKLATPL